MKILTRSLLAAAILLAAGADAQSEGFNKSGRTAFQFVKIGVGARQTALGEAAIAIVRDVNAIFWNPASISGIGSVEGSASFTRWFADMNYYGAAAGFRWEGVGTIALNAASLNYGDLQEALVRVPSGSADTRTGATFTGGDVMVGAAFAREFNDRLSIGIGAKMLQEDLWTYSVRTWAFDVGTNYDIGYKGLRLAMSAQNFGPAVKWLEHSNRPEGYDLPLVYRIGTAMNLVDREEGFLTAGDLHKVTLAVDAIHTNDYGDRFHLGAEYVFDDILSLRAGYRFNYDEGKFSAGIGLRQRISGVEVRIDYAYVSYEFLDSPHRFTISFAY